MKRIFTLILFFQLIILSRVFAGDDFRNHVCAKVWMVSYIEVERYVYSDTAVGTTYIQLLPNGVCIIKTIEHKEVEKNHQGKLKISEYFNKGKVSKESTTWSFDLNNGTIIINPSTDHPWVWKVQEASANKLIFTSNMQIDPETSYEYKFTMIPLKGCSSLKDN